MVMTRRQLLEKAQLLGLPLALWNLTRAFPNSLGLTQVNRALTALGGSGEALAQAAAAPQFTLVHFVMVDKIQASLFQAVTGIQPSGSDGQNGAAQTASDFRSMGLTKLFGDPLKALPTNVSLSILNAWESGNAGHSLQNSFVSTDLGGVNAAFEQLSGGTGLFGPVGFGMSGSVNNSADAFQASGGKALQSYATVDQLSGTVQGSIAPITANQSGQALLGRFDQLVSTNTSFRAAIEQLAHQMQGAVPGLTSATTNKDPVDQQVKSVIALASAGVARNFMITIPYDDTNAGGNLTTAGGSRNLDPFSATPLVANALVALHAAIPNLVCVSTSDGGRDVANGDVSAGMAFMTGPNTIIQNGIVGDKYTSSAQLGTNFTTAQLSSGTAAVARPQNWYSTALRAIGLNASVDYVPQALVKG